MQPLVIYSVNTLTECLLTSSLFVKTFSFIALHDSLLAGNSCALRKLGCNETTDQNKFHVEVDNLLVPHCESYNLRCVQLPFVPELGNVVAAAECMLLQ